MIGVLLLHGSSGAPDSDRARLLEAEGYDVLAPRWTVTHEVALESFPLDELADHDRLVVMGSSWGAEAALLLGALDERVDAVVAFAPSAYVWGRVLEDGSQRSVNGYRAVNYDIPRGCVAGYMPELNVLCGIADYSTQSGQPVTKHLEVEITPHQLGRRRQPRRRRPGPAARRSPDPGP